MAEEDRTLKERLDYIQGRLDVIYWQLRDEERVAEGGPYEFRSLSWQIEGSRRIQMIVDRLRELRIKTAGAPITISSDEDRRRTVVQRLNDAQTNLEELDSGSFVETQYGKREYTINLWAESFHVADAVLNEDGYLIIQASEYAYEVNGQAEWRLDLEACKRALQMMASAQWKGVENFTNPLRFWENFINENDDAETAVVFLQLALFGEVVYG